MSRMRAAPLVLPLRPWTRPLRRTYTTDYVGTLVPASGTAPSEWSSTAKRMDRAQLMERAPILFAAEVPLYESEMDDNGVSSCSVRVRAALCWGVLCNLHAKLQPISRLCR